MSRKNCNGVMLVNTFFKIFSHFFKIRVECPFKDLKGNIETTLKNYEFQDFHDFYSESDSG